MKIDIITLFPEMFEGPFATSMVKKAQDMGACEINIHNLRNWATDRRKTVDDRPYGGGKGMVLRVDIIDKAIKHLKTNTTNSKFESLNSKQSSKFKILNSKNKERIIILSPQGKVFDQKKARELAKLDHLILIAGHYEGFDERVRNLVDEEISIGEYVLTGGELPAMVITDAVARLLPGVLEPEAVQNESFSPVINHHPLAIKYDFPQYTRPENYKGMKVPKILLSGNHKKIEKWRRQKSLEKSSK
jgi:tRNA (guanine37-N1)-methyltransferase